MKHTTANYVATTATALLLTLGSTCAFAFGSASAGSSATHFDGFTLGVDLDVDQARDSIDYSSRTSSSYSRASARGRENFLNPALSGIYRHALSDNFLLGLGAKFQLTDSQVKDGNNNLRLSATQSLFLTPAYAVSDKTMFYGKLGVAERAFEGGGPASLVKGMKFSGLHYGVGAQFAYKPNLHFTVEFALTDYKEQNKRTITGSGSDTDTEDLRYKIGTGTLSLGMAYRF